MAAAYLDLVQSIQEALDLIFNMERGDERDRLIDTWTHICSKYIDLYRGYLHAPGQSHADKSRIQNALGLLQSFSERFQRELVREREVNHLHEIDQVLERGVVGGNIDVPVNIDDIDDDLIENRVAWQELDSAFNNRMRTGLIINLKHKDLLEFLADAEVLVTTKFTTILRNDGNVKANAVLTCKFENVKSDEVNTELKYFNTRNAVILPSTDIHQWFLENIANPLLVEVEDFEHRDSGWSMVEIINLIIGINEYVPLCGAASTFVSLPAEVQRKRAVINVKNEDDRCFLWSILAALYPVDYQRNPCRTCHYKQYLSELNINGLHFPMTLKDVSKFEELNNLSVNVYGIESETFKNKKSNIIVPLYLSNNFNSSYPTIHLLMVKSNIESDDEKIFHFAWIKDLSRLVSKQMTFHNGKQLLCDRCLYHFNKREAYENHIRDCIQINHVRMEFPKENSMKFKNYCNKSTVPFVVYADLECILTPEGEHVPHSVGYYKYCSYDPSFCKYKQRRGKDCIEWFVKKLHKLSQKVDARIKNVKTMNNLTNTEWKYHYTADNCYICDKPFHRGELRCRDHCHFTGKYRGPAHNSCNLNYKESTTIPIVFHNLSGYDSHFIIKSIATSFPGKVDLLPINKEKYISFTKHVDGTIVQLRFIDSLKFMASSIDKLASYLSDSDKIVTQQHYSDPDQFQLVTRKGVFPYEYIDSEDRLDDDKLPDIEQFYSKLNDSNVTTDDYNHALNVWNKFNFKTLGEYSDLYLKTDVLLLTDIFQNFRKACLDAYELDPLHYYTTPGLAFDAMLKYTEVNLELLQDPEKLLFIEKSIRGGVAQCSNRYAKANNKYIGKSFDPSKDESYLMYFDVNNLYGAAMSEPLPTGEFIWTDALKNVDDILNVPDDSPVGYMLEVDLEYPRDLHELHKDLPLCPEHYTPNNSKYTKLMTTLYNKNNYVIHYRNLKQCIQLGMKLTKIHRILQFSQSPWLQKYIQLNTDKRKQAKNEFEKNFFKLMNNAVYGKTMENVRKHKDVRLVTQWEGRGVQKV